MAIPSILPACRAIVALALPPRCAGCGAVTDADHRFCAPCWQSMSVLGPPWCARCAAPFAFDRGEDAVCAPCLADPPEHDGARAAVAYGAVAKRVALRLKYGGRVALAETAARLMVRLMPDDAEVLVPVPLARWRLWSRGYNQAGLIAKGLARRSGVRMVDTVLERRRATQVLRGMGRRGRARAVAGAFAAGPAAPIVAGRHVVLVDDVYTTGATAAACTRVLRQAGARRVTVLCWARVIESIDAADD